MKYKKMDIINYILLINCNRIFKDWYRESFIVVFESLRFDLYLCI